ncbi:NAD(P)-dependent oxidoreductase [Alistipes provencensis]
MLVRERKDHIAKVDAPRAFPWRVAIVGSDTDLAASNLSYLLAAPSRLDDIAWIKPGKVAWEWWNDWNLSGVDFRAGVNPATYKYYIDFAASEGIEYVILDEAWGFRVLCCDPPREELEHCGFLPLEEVAREADILTFHTPLDDTTRHMAGERLFRQMKPDAMVINSSRGEVVDGDALLRSGLRWALDVWEHEPNLNPQLLEKALLATPHIAGYSEQGKANATAMSVAALARCFGLPLEGWYPPEASPSAPRPIAWQELCSTIGEVYDIEAESRRLKGHPGDFESLRDHYAYRREYF